MNGLVQREVGSGERQGGIAAYDVNKCGAKGVVVGQRLADERDRLARPTGCHHLGVEIHSEWDRCHAGSFGCLAPIWRESCPL